MDNNNNDIQFIKADAKSAELFNIAAKAINRPIAILNGFAIMASWGAYDGTSLPKQAESMGLVPCENFEGYTLYFSRGNIFMRKEAPTSSTAGDIEKYGRVYF